MKSTEKRKNDRKLAQFRELVQIPGIRRNGKHNYIGSVLDAHGKLQHNRVDIADVFSEFYSDLHAKHEGSSEDTALELLLLLQSL